MLGEELTETYFPNIIGPTWIYEDQDGNELKRSVIEGEEIAGDIYHVFSYEPAIDDSKDFHRYFHPKLFNIGEEWITFLVGDDVEKAVYARLNREMKIFSNFAKKSLQNSAPPELSLTVDLKYDVQTEAADKLLFLPRQAAIDEEWDAIQINAKITMKFDIQTAPNFQDAQEMPEQTFDFNIHETGKILGTENVKTKAGTYEDCLKIEYRTETEMITNSPSGLEETPGESVTILWLANNVGVVKIHQEAENIFLHLFSEKDIENTGISDEDAAEITSTKIKTLELKKYKIKPNVSQKNNND